MISGVSGSIIFVRSSIKTKNPDIKTETSKELMHQTSKLNL